MGVLQVIHPGLLTTVQDKGRTGYQQFGMPTAGAMDPFALQAANLLTGNLRSEGALEITFPGFEAFFTEDTLIAITGADLGAELSGVPVVLWRSFLCPAGSILRFTGLKSGCRAYLAAAGGFDVPQVMGSKSTYIRAEIGGWKGRRLEAGDRLPIGPLQSSAAGAGKRLLPSRIPVYSSTVTLEVILGPQASYFTRQSLQTFLSKPYRVGMYADRMGYRLEGPPLEHVRSADIISDGIPLGAVQVPGHGMPIVMLADRQTTGGYPKIATVITADIPKLAQLKMGDSIHFCEVTLEEARRRLLEQERLLSELEQAALPRIRHFEVRLGDRIYYTEAEEHLLS